MQVSATYKACPNSNTTLCSNWFPVSCVVDVRPTHAPALLTGCSGSSGSPLLAAETTALAFVCHCILRFNAVPQLSTTAPSHSSQLQRPHTPSLPLPAAATGCGASAQPDASRPACQATLQPQVQLNHVTWALALAAPCPSACRCRQPQQAAAP